MTHCHRCGSRADLFLCRTCRDRVQADLADLGCWWLDRLTESAVGQTRLSDNGGRRTERDRLHGDEYLDTLEADPRKALARALSEGGCNLGASELLAAIADMLGYWVRVLCESRAIAMPKLSAGTVHGKAAAVWLAVHVDSIAASEDAADIAADILGWGRDVGDNKSRPGLIAQVRRVVNRPIQYRDLGKCPEMVSPPESTGPVAPCGEKLRAPIDAEYVRCRSCGAKHRAQWLLAVSLAEIRKDDAQPLPIELIRKANAEQLPAFRVPERTLRHWLSRGKLAPCETRNGEPLYRWADVEQLRAKRERMAVG